MSHDPSACRTRHRPAQILPTLLAGMLLAAVGVGVLVGAPHAATGAVVVQDIEIVGTPKL